MALVAWRRGGRPGGVGTGVRAVMFDVDGVVVRRRDDGGWTAGLERDLGVCPTALRTEFSGPRRGEVVDGRADLRDRLGPVLRRVKPDVGVNRLVDYWFANDATLDHDLLADIAALRTTGVEVHLATLQEHGRALHLWRDLGMRERFDAMHCAADLG